MGSAKEQMHDNAIEKRDRKIADHLGLTYDELSETEFEMESDDVHAVSLITFSDSSPKEILNKIADLKEGRSVEIETSVFTDGDFSDDFSSEDFNTSESGFVDIHPDTAKAMADAVKKQNKDK